MSRNKNDGKSWAITIGLLLTGAQNTELAVFFVFGFSILNNILFASL